MMIYKQLLCCIISVVIRTGSSQDSKQVDTCDTVMTNDLCSSPHCNFTCVLGPECFNKDKEDIWGTTIYSVDSKLCKAAIHDLRISSWNENQRGFTYNIIPYENQDVYPSLRYGIKTWKKLNPEKAFRFLSPRITEDLFNVILVQESFIIDNGPLRKPRGIECVANLKGGKNLQLWKYPYNYYDEIFLIGQTQESKIVTNMTDLPQMVSCKVSGTMLSEAITHQINIQDVTPEVMTKTVNVGERVEIIMIGFNNDIFEYKWVKDKGNDIPFQFTDILQENKRKLVINKVEIYHSGFYSLYYVGDNNLYPASTRLIVRVCPKGKYGEDCANDCPHCINGGVCHDIVGDCICPPKYYGNRCEKVCKSGSGLSCDYIENYNETKRLLFCLPDPFGCSCFPGYKDLQCTEECPGGKYGIRCEHDCGDCEGGVQCAKDTGACTKCAITFKKPFCKENRPKYDNDFTLSYNEEKKGILVLWEPWKRSGTNGEGPVIAYITKYRMFPTDTWDYLSDFDDGRTNKPYSRVNINVKPGKTYAVMIVLEDPDGANNPFTSIAKNITIPCEAPGSQAGAISIGKDYKFEEISSKLIVEISWTTLNESAWHCNYICYEVLINGTDFEKKITDKTSISINVAGCSNYFISVNPFNSLGSSKGWSIDYTSPSQIPEAVENFEEISEDQLMVTFNWKNLDHRGCKNEPIALVYEVYVKLEKWLHHCLEIPEIKWYEITKPPIQVELRPSANYEIGVRAKTKQGFEIQGKINKRTKETMTSAPDGIPENVKLQAQDSSLQATWSLPPCNKINGKIISYNLQLTGSEDWNQKDIVNHKFQVINDQDFEFHFTKLQPFSKYKLAISAENDKGIGPEAYVTASTSPTAPYPPNKIHIYSKSSNALWLAWHDAYPPRGKIVGYEVAEQSVLFPPHNFKPEDTKCHEKIQYRGWICKKIDGLQSNKLHKLQLRAINGVHYVGDWSSMFSGVTREEVPEIPSNLKLKNRGETFLHFEWIGPFFLNGEITGYKLKYRVKETFNTGWSGKEEEITTNANSEDFKWENLYPGTSYMISLRATNIAGDSQWLEGGPFNTLMSAPSMDPPIILEDKITDTTVTIQLRINEFIKNPYSTHYVIVIKESGRLKRALPELDINKLNDYINASSLGQLQYIAAEFDSSIDDNHTFEIGKDVRNGKYQNPSLTTGHKYYFSAGSLLDYNGEKKFGYAIYPKAIEVKSKIIPPVSVGGFTTAELIGLIVGICLLLLIIILLLLFICLRRKNKRKKKKSNKLKKTEINKAFINDNQNINRVIDLHNGNNHSNNPSITQENYVYRPAFDNESYIDENDEDKHSLEKIEMKGIDAYEFEHPKHHYVTDRDNWENDSKQKSSDFKLPKSFGAISIPELPIYTSEMKFIKGFESEYKIIPSGELGYCEAGLSSDNKLKNRYPDLLPYDHSRVILKTTSDDPSDYINANYIDGFQGKNAYIAAQGPLPDTINDFWRMVWQEDISKIVMLTNIYEDGDLKCERYWPQDKSEIYGNIKVTTNKVEQFANYIIRTFILEKDGKEKNRRVVNQYQFTAWPDHGIPQQPTALVDFYKKVKGYLPNTSGPILVHCSAGVGRTGTFILLDTLVDQAKEEGAIDVVHYLSKARHQRKNLVPSLEQYVFLYDTLIETLQARNTTILCTEFSPYLKGMKSLIPESNCSFLEEEFQILEAISPKLRASDCRTAMLKENYHRNRFLDIIPADLCRVHLWTMGLEIRNAYINAVYVNSHLKKNAYMATQMPVPHTPTDFWRMVYDHKCVCIAMLNELDLYDPSCTQYWPHYGSKKYDIFQVTLVSTLVHKDVVTRTFSVVNTLEIQEPALEVKQFHLYEWKNYKPLPPSKESFFQLVDMIDEWQQNTGNNPIVIHCMNGVTATGLLCAFLNIRERIFTDQEIDIFLDVKAIRQSRPHFIINFMQYEFLYEITEEFLQKFQVYSSTKPAVINHQIIEYGV